MKYNLHSEHIKQRLFGSMVVIIGSIFLISIPLTLNSFHAYQKSEQALAEISVLKNLTDLSNLVSEERGPSNNVMSSTPESLEKNTIALKKHREKLDQKLNETIALLGYKHYSKLMSLLEHDFKIALSEGRIAVDEYTKFSPAQRSVNKFDYSIQKMYTAWDVARSSLEYFVKHSAGKTSDISNYYTIVLLLTDLRDQAGRVASNIIAPLTFQETLPDENREKSLQTQHQAYYLWKLISTLQPEQLKTEKYLELHQHVQTQFMDQGIPLVENLIDDSTDHLPYSLTATELTDEMVGKFSTVVDLQSYVINNFIPHIQHENQNTFRQFIFSIVVSLISLITALFTLAYARNRIFKPLIEARQKILMLANKNSDGTDQEYYDTSISLFEAIQKLQTKLQQRDILEFQLHNIANTDALTGVSNRLALEKYVQILEEHTEKLSRTGLIILDIDDFKKINDNYGHIVGDQVIQFIANKLKSNLRTSDVIVRYGGDEFIIILDSIEVKDTLLVAEKIRNDIANSVFFVAEKETDINISVSAGVAVGATTWKELFDRADKSLLKVKTSGKNAVAD